MFSSFAPCDGWNRLASVRQGRRSGPIARARRPRRREALLGGVATAVAAGNPARSGNVKVDADWATKDTRRMLHSVMVVRDIPAQQTFFRDILSMRDLRFRSFPDGSANGFSGYLAEDAGFSLELVQKADAAPIRVGSGFRHFTVAVPSLEASLSHAEALGFAVVEGQNWEEGEVYVQDPSGYLWELNPGLPSVIEPFRELNLMVRDLRKSLEFYRDTLGMEVAGVQEREDISRAFVCWGAIERNTSFALTQVKTGPSAGKPVDLGSGAYIQMACSTDDVYKTAEAVRAAGYQVSREPSPVPGIGTRVTKVQDPDGWTIAFVDNGDFIQELCKADLLKGAACAPPGAA